MAELSDVEKVVQSNDLDLQCSVSSMKVADLKRELKARGLAATGNKTDLIDRLQSALGLPKGVESLESPDDVNEDEVLNDDMLIPDEEPTGDGLEVNEEEFLTPTVKSDSKKPIEISSANGVSPPLTKAPERIQQLKPLSTKRILARNTVVPVATSLPPTSEENTTNSASESSKVVSISTTSLTLQERAALRAKKFGTAVGQKDKLKSRAERFGLATKTKGPVKLTSPLSASISSTGKKPDLDHLKKRAERFGQSVSTVMKQLEAKERLILRKQRFGNTAETSVVRTSVKDADADQKKLQRQGRFAVA